MDITEERGQSLAEEVPELNFPAMLTVPNKHVGEVWEKVGGMFLTFEEQEPVLYTRADMFRLLSVGLMQLHLSHDGEKFHMALITEIVDYPQTKLCRLLLGTGEQPEKVLELWPWFAKWCKERGVEWTELVGRPGWEKVLRPLGFQKKSIILTKRVE